MSKQQPLELWPETPAKTPRLGKQQAAVNKIMATGNAYTLNQIQMILLQDYGIRATETSVGARIRDLRKPESGGHIVHREKVPNVPGLFEYRMEIPTP